MLNLSERMIEGSEGFGRGRLDPEVKGFTVGLDDGSELHAHLH